ncbi:MAG: PadR family transcriptional regulator [Gemmatimonadota bacterium]
MDRELKRGSLEMLLLALVRESERYGYELVTTLEERSGGDISVSGGTLYPVLYRLEEDGHLETRWEAEGRGAPRKYYRITGRGRSELERRLDEWRRYAAAVTRVLEAATGGENSSAHQEDGS